MHHAQLNGGDALGQILLAELPRRQVDRHRKLGQPGVVPGLELGAGGPDHPVADGDDEAGFLRQGDELGRWNQAVVLGLPADQGLHAADFPRFQIHLGLVVEQEFLPFQGVVQIGLSYVLLTRAMGRVPALEAALLLMLEPVLTPLWAWLAHGERPTGWALAGAQPE